MRASLRRFVSRFAYPALEGPTKAAREKEDGGYRTLCENYEFSSIEPNTRGSALSLAG